MDMFYISYPYTGNEKENRIKAEKIRQEMQDHEPDTCYVLPLGMFGTDNSDYCRVLARCLELEARCDAVVFCPGWENSAGCKAEMAFALQHGLVIDYMTPYKEGGGDE